MRNWISANEQLPEHSGDYLCVYDLFYNILGKSYHNYVQTVAYFDCITNDGAGVFEHPVYRGSDVVFWMELPELPESIAS